VGWNEWVKCIYSFSSSQKPNPKIGTSKEGALGFSDTGVESGVPELWEHPCQFARKTAVFRSFKFKR